MSRLLLTVVFVLTGAALFGQDWLYASVKWSTSSGAIKRFKLVSSTDEYPLYLFPRSQDDGEEKAYDWLGGEGGVLSLCTQDSGRRDSLSLIVGQEVLTASRSEEGWQIHETGINISPFSRGGQNGYQVTKTLAPVPGTQVIPEPVLMLTILPHPRRRNRFAIEQAGTLNSTPTIVLELAIVIALVVEGISEG